MALDERLGAQGFRRRFLFPAYQSVGTTVRKAGNGLMYEQSVEYRRGHAALENVAQTGYRALADCFVGLIFQAP